MVDDPTTIARTEEDARVASQWRTVYLKTAWITGVFSSLVLAVMVWNALMLRVADPLDSKELLELKAALQEQPRDEATKEKIRALDAKLREEYFRRRRTSAHGAWLLLVGVVCCLLSLRATLSYRRELPMPDTQADVKPDRDTIRVALMTMAAVMCVSAVAVVLTGRAGFLRESARAEGRPGTATEEVQPTGARATDTGATVPTSVPTDDEIRAQWPQFRGPFGLGVAGATALPMDWDGASGQGVLWQVDLPLPGNSSPVVWGKNVFVTGGTEAAHEVLCFDAKSGDLRWRGQVPFTKGPVDEDEEVYEATGHAAPTPATDGQHVFAAFVDGVVAGFDLQGNRLWTRDFGPIDNAYGYASSLAIEGGHVLVLIDQAGADDGKSRLYALNAADGTTAWEAKRAVPMSWGSLATVEVDGSKQVVTVADPWLIAHDASTGKEVWKAEVLSGEIVPSIAFASPLVFACEPYSRVVAVNAGGSGNVTESGLVWEGDEGIPDISSPVAGNGLLFCVAGDGWLVCYDAQKGGKLWEKELDFPVNASPLIVGDTLLVVSLQGEAVFLATERAYRELGRGKLGLPEDEETVTATPAVVGGRLYVRTSKRLFCLGAP